MSEHQNVIDQLNKIWAEIIGPSRKHSMSLWSIPRRWKGTRYLFGYTPWKTKDNGKVGYFALKYREFKNGKTKLVKSVRFGKRKTAKARAAKWYNEYYRQPD